MEQLMIKLAEAKASVREEGTISADELEKELCLWHEECSIDQIISEAEQEFAETGVSIDAKKAFDKLENKYIDK